MEKRNENGQSYKKQKPQASTMKCYTDFKNYEKINLFQDRCFQNKVSQSLRCTDLIFKVPLAGWKNFVIGISFLLNRFVVKQQVLAERS